MAEQKSLCRKARRVGSRSMACAVVLAVYCVAANSAFAEPIKIGFVNNFSAGPVFIAQEKGYFAAEGVPAELAFFDGPTVAAATVAGSIDFGVTGFGAAFYSLAGQGALKLIAGFVREAPSFHNNAYIVSKQAYAGGFTSLKDFPGHSVAISQFGALPHYNLGLLIEKYGFDAKSIRLLPLQSVANMSSAVSGGQADSSIIGAVASLPLLQRGQAKLLGWVGDETPWELGAAFTLTRNVTDRRDTVERFLRAYRKGARDYHDAFTGPDGQRRDGPTAPEMLTIIARYTGAAVETVALGLPYCDAEGRLDVKDVLHQIAWYKAQGMIKAEVDGGQAIDKRYVIPLPAH